MDTAPLSTPRKWQPLDRVDRRVVGVLIEKAKTTPDNYPLSLNALVNGCNQKSNRSPQMQLDDSQVEESLERLRKLGAVAQIEGDGRVDKFRHLAYDWLGVDKVELAVMGELLLRGAQTLGELRGRAARMEPIADIGALRPIVESLQQKELILFLTPPGRGCTVTHAVQSQQSIDKERREVGGSESANVAAGQVRQATAPSAAAVPSSPSVQEELAALKRDIAELRARIEEVEAR